MYNLVRGIEYYLCLAKIYTIHGEVLWIENGVTGNNRWLLLVWGSDQPCTEPRGWVSTKHLVVKTRVVNKLDGVVHEFHVFQRRSAKKVKWTRALFTKIRTQSNARKHVDWRCTWDFSDNFNIGVRDGSVLTSELMSWDEMAVVKSNADRLNKNSDFPSVTCFYHQSFFIDLGLI